MTLRVKSPLEKIIVKLKEIETPEEREGVVSKLNEVIRMIQKFAEEIEHERANAVVEMVSNVKRMEDLQFQRGRLYQLKRLQRDFERE